MTMRVSSATWISLVLSGVKQKVSAFQASLDSSNTDSAAGWPGAYYQPPQIREPGVEIAAILAEAHLAAVGPPASRRGLTPRSDGVAIADSTHGDHAVPGEAGIMIKAGVD